MHFFTKIVISTNCVGVTLSPGGPSGPSFPGTPDDPGTP